MLEVSWPLLLGPYALTVGLVVALLALYNGRVTNPDKVVRRVELDEERARADRAIGAGEASAKALENLATAVVAGDAGLKETATIILEELRAHRDSEEGPATRRGRTT